MTDTDHLDQTLAQLLSLGKPEQQVGEGERIFRWPERDAPGSFRIACSCGRWDFVGTADEIYRAGLTHDDSPWNRHVVGVRERLSS